MALPRNEQGGVRIGRTEGLRATYPACGAVPQLWAVGGCFWDGGFDGATARAPERANAGGIEA